MYSLREVPQLNGKNEYLMDWQRNKTTDRGPTDGHIHINHLPTNLPTYLHACIHTATLTSICVKVFIVATPKFIPKKVIKHLINVIY